MIAAGWTLAVVGAVLLFAGFGIKSGNAASLRAVAEELDRVPLTLRRILEAESGCYMLLGLGLVLLSLALFVFLIASVLP